MTDDPFELDPWLWYHTACEHPEWIGTERLPIHESHPMNGYFRVRLKGGEWETVAIFRDEETGVLQAERAGRPVFPDRINDLWVWACRQPVYYEIWREADAGKGWPDVPDRAPGIGDNIREADPLEALNIEWLGEKELVEEFLTEPVRTQADADRAAIWADRLIKIKNRADALHKVEKQPWLDGGRDVDNKWRDLRELPHDLAVRLKRHQKAFLDEEDRKERQRVAEAEAEARRLRQLAERAAREAIQRQDAGDPDAMAKAGRLVAAAKDAEAAAVYVNPSAGRTGARTKLVTRTSAVVTDWDALWQALRDREEVRSLFQQLADRAAKAGVALPGTEINREKVPA